MELKEDNEEERRFVNRFFEESKGKEEEEDGWDTGEPYYHLPSECYDSTEPMDIPSVGNSEYFTFAPVRRHQHPTNPNTNGLISSRILPDGSNTIRFTTALSTDFQVPDKEEPDISAKMRMASDQFKEEYSGRSEIPNIVYSGHVGLTWKE